MKKPVAKTKASVASYPALVTGIGALLEQSRRAVVRAANCFMTATYWEVGRRIVEFEQGGKKRTGYGEELLERLAKDLTERHGRGFSRQNLQNMRQFYMAFGEPKIRQTLSRKSPAQIRQTASGKSSGPAVDAQLVTIHAADYFRFTLPELAEALHLPPLQPEGISTWEKSGVIVDDTKVFGHAPAGIGGSVNFAPCHP